MTTRISLFFTEENNSIAQWIKEQAKLNNSSINNFIIEILNRHVNEYKEKSSIPKEIQLDITETRSKSDS